MRHDARRHRLAQLSPHHLSAEPAGLAVGSTLVFSLTAGSFVTPAILGGSSAQMLGMLVDQQILAVYDWPFGATVASVLVAIVFGVNIVSMRLLDRRTARGMPDEQPTERPARLAVAADHGGGAWSSLWRRLS